MSFKKVAAINKNKHFLLLYNRFVKNMLLVFGLYENTKWNKSDFVTKFAGIIIMFFCKNISQTANTVFFPQFFFTDQVKHKTVNKPNSIRHSVNLR